MKKLPYKMIAKEANVSLMSVSNALRHPDQVKPETLKKVRDAVSSLGGQIRAPTQPMTKPVVAPRPHRRLRFVTTGVPLAVRQVPVYSRIFQSAIEEAGKLKFDLSFTNLEGARDFESGSYDDNIDALIIMGNWTRRTREPKVPVITLMSTVYPFATDHVGYHRPSVGRLIAEHFHRRGIRSAAYVGPDDHDRFSSFRDTYRQLDPGAEIRSHLIDAPFRISAGRQIIDPEAVRKVALEMVADPPEAIFCHSDEMAADLRSCCIEQSPKGRHAIWAGCNNDHQWQRFLGKDSVTVDICSAEIGRLAVRRAVEITRSPSQTRQTILLEPYLVTAEEDSG